MELLAAATWFFFFFFQAEDGIRDVAVTGVQTCALPIFLKGMGGAMDLVSGAKRVIVAMEQVARDGSKKLLKECRLPLTGKKCVNTVMSELAVIDITPQGLLLREVAPGVTPDDVQKVTEPKLRISPELRAIKI